MRTWNMPARKVMRQILAQRHNMSEPFTEREQEEIERARQIRTKKDRRKL